MVKILIITIMLFGLEKLEIVFLVNLKLFTKFKKAKEDYCNS